MKPPAKRLNGDDFSCNGDLVSDIATDWTDPSRHALFTYMPSPPPTITDVSSHQPHQATSWQSDQSARLWLLMVSHVCPTRLTQ